MVARFVAWLAAGLAIGGCGLPLYTPEDFADDGESSEGSATHPGTSPTTTADESSGGDPADASTSGDTSTGAEADDTTSTSSSSDEPQDTGDTTGDPTADPTADPDPLDCPTQLDPCDHLTDEPLHALGLNCTSMGEGFVNKVNAAELGDLEFKAAPPMFGMQPWQVARAYGTHVEPNAQRPFWGAREGKKLLIISTGLLPPPNDDGAVIIPGSDVYNDVAFGGEFDSDELPPPMIPADGSASPMGFTDCDGHGDCSNTLFTQWVLGGKNPDDKLWFNFTVTAPPQTRGFAFDFALFSAEFPEYVDSPYNDIFVVWQDSEAYTGNVTFIDGRPITVTAVWPIDYIGQCAFNDNDCTGKDPHLAGTGFIDDGGATGWYTATSGVNPNETFLLSFAIFDMGDSTYDTTALLDNFRWDCDGCVPNEVDSCGVEPQ